jgi:asparagine synthase (glutamine-hydrolysing)
MCGIFYTNEEPDDQSPTAQTSINSLRHRGPDKSTTVVLPSGAILGFHRLMINGQSAASDQPLHRNGNYLLCNGEIYNHEALQVKYGVTCLTGSDCEIILHLYEKIGFRATVAELDGEFALVLVTPNTVYAARDPYGVRALYLAVEGTRFGLASENKGLYPLFKPENIIQFPPGCIQEFDPFDSTGIPGAPEQYYTFNHEIKPPQVEVIPELRKRLIKAVVKRMMCGRTDDAGLPAIGAYLSGGFDSSAIAAILQREFPGQLHTFSIGFANSPDLLYARKVAVHIRSNHHEVILTEAEALAAIPEVIRMIESYDTTTVRASTMMYLLSKYISENTQVKVMFSGEGSDEASGSYRYFHNAPNSTEFHAETLRLLRDLCYFDNLRADKSSAAWGLELRVPFLDLDFLAYYMTLDPALKTQNGLEKYALREAVKDYLPADVLYRAKEAMSDGVSCHGRSWSTIIQQEAMRITGLTDGLAAEKAFYLNTFKRFYAGCEAQIPYYWLPKWCGDVQDPSARILPIYNAVLP